MKGKKSLTLFASVLLVLVLAASILVGACAEPAPTPAPAPAPSPAPAPAPAPTPAPAPEKTIELSLSGFWPPVSGHAKALDEWAKQINEETNGRVKITCHHGGSLLKPPEQWPGVVAGTADIAFAMAIGVRGKFMEDHCNFSLGLNDVMQNLEFRDFIIDTYPKINEEWKDAKLFFQCVPGPSILATSFPFNKMEDLKGKTIRVAAESQAKVVEPMGLSPVAMPMSDAFLSMEKGLIVSLLTFRDAMVSFKLADVSKYWYDWDLYAPVGNPPFFAMNWDSWNKLPADIQGIFEATMPSLRLEIQERGFKGDDDRGEAYAKEAGCEFVPISPELREQIYASQVQYYLDMAKKGDEGGMPATELMIACEERKETNVKGYVSPILKALK